MTAFDALLDNKIRVVEAAQAGATNEFLSDPTVGPTQFQKLDYPAVQILPESTDDQGGNQFAHTLRVNCYFERERDTDYLDVLEVIKDVTTGVIQELGEIDCVLTYRPTTIEDYAGQLDNTLLLLVSIQFTVTTQVDLADT